MGRPKLLLPWRGTSLLAATVDAFARAGADPIVVVLAPEAGELLRWAREAGCRGVVNPRPEQGMLSSIREGLNALPTSAARGALISPADLPRLTAETVRSVAAAVSSDGALALPRYAGRRGHPLGIPADLLPEVEELDPAVGLRQLLVRRADRLLELDVDDPGCVRDVDTPDDYRDLLGVTNDG